MLRWAVPVIAVLVIAVGALAAVWAYAARIAELETIFPNIFVSGVDVGGMTVEQAQAALESSDAAPDTDASVTVRLPMEKTLTVTAGELGVYADAAPAVREAYAYGRGGSLFETMLSYRACLQAPVELTWEVDAEVDEEKLRGLVETAVNEVNALLLGSDAQIGEDGVTLIKGMDAERIDPEEVFGQVLEAFREERYDDITVEFGAARDGAADDPYSVLEAVYQAILVEPKNAAYDKQTGTITESVRGVSFDLDEARRLWDAAAAGEEVFIPYVFTEPEIDSERLEQGLFADLLSEKTTSLSGSSSNRINNVSLSASAINETILEPGETFDYNGTVGQRTTARGYKEAGAYSGGRHVNEVGGGICQTSSTLYYCAMYANLEITVRSCHYFAVSYLPRGFDATVSWGGPDFRFVNSRDFPVKIRAWVSNGSLTVQIWGTDADGSYVKMTSDTWEDSTYYYAQTYRTVYAADGTEISSRKEAYSSYHKYEETGETPVPETNTTPEPEPTPEETPVPTQAPAPTAAPPAETAAPPTQAPPADTPAPTTPAEPEPAEPEPAEPEPPPPAEPDPTVPPPPEAEPDDAGDGE